jgi:site-specific DNA-methyltransferase (adenine-specific)
MQLDFMAGDGFRLYQGDAIDFLKSLPDASIDCVITDPAYESLEQHRSRGTTPRLVNWFETFPNDRFPELFTEFYRVLKQNSHCYVFCDQVTMFHIKPIGESVGFKFWKPIVWDKEAIGMGYHYRSQYEMILFFEKGKRKLNDLGIGDVISQKRLRKGKQNPDCYPTEKPVEVAEILVKQSTQPGEIILDCFAGSCSTGVAALNQDRRFIGADISDDAIELAKHRFCQRHEQAA